MKSIILNDFSFRNPEEIYRELRNNCDTNKSMSNMKMNETKPDIVDEKYDAFLANYKTLEESANHLCRTRQKGTFESY